MQIIIKVFRGISEMLSSELKKPSAQKRMKLCMNLLDKGSSDLTIATALKALTRHGNPKDHETMEKQAERMLKLI